MNQSLIRRVASLLGHAARKTASHPRDALLSARMALWVLLISGLAELTSLPRAHRMATLKVRSVSPVEISHTAAKLGRTIDSVLGIDLFVFRRSCWKRAMVLHRFLALSGVESQIRFGVRKEADGTVNGHAWLERGGQPLLEDNATNYVVTFSLPPEYPRSRRPAPTQS